MADRRSKLEEWRKKRSLASGVAASSSKRPKTSLTPSKLDFSQRQKQQSNKENTEVNSTPVPQGKVDAATPPKSQVTKFQSVRERLAQSAKKRQHALEESRTNRDKKRSNLSTTHTMNLQQAHSVRKPEQAEETKVPEASVSRGRAEVRRRNLEHLAQSQMEIVDGLISCGKLKEARECLREMRGDVEDLLTVGAFWTRLADIEIKHGNIARASSVWIHAMRHCNDKDMLQQCSDFMEKHLLRGLQTLDELDALLLEPFAPQQAGDKEDQSEEEEVIFDEKDELSALLDCNPPSEVKSRPRPPSMTKMSSLSGKKPLRVPVSQPADGGVCSARKHKQSARKEGGMGSYVSMAAVKLSKVNKEELGNEMTLTPVRRSARLARGGGREQANTASMLKSTNYTFTPNPSITSSRDQEEDLLV